TATSGIASLSSGLSTTDSHVATLSTGLSVTNHNVAALSTTVVQIAAMVNGQKGVCTVSNGAMQCSVDGYQPASAQGQGAIATGIAATADGAGAVAQGEHARATAAGAVAIGQGAQANGSPTVAVGNNAAANGHRSVALGADSVANGANSVALGAGSVASADNTVSVGAPGNERRITNVAPGANWTDAVNVGQLNGVSRRVTQVTQGAYSGLAMSAAMLGIPPVDDGKRFNVGAGVGSYAGYSAMAVGMGARFNGGTVMKMGVSTTSGSGNHVLVSVGVGHSW
uniref:YadA family autotransporter adhesin n=1 Tax=Frateuria defendens TaxID=2219559 RepID=UPI000A9EFEB7